MTLFLRSSILAFSFHFHSSILTFLFGYAYCMKILLLYSLTFYSILIDFSLLSIGTLWSHNIPDAFFHFIPLLLFYKACPLISQSFWTFDPRYWKWSYFGISFMKFYYFSISISAFTKLSLSLSLSVYIYIYIHVCARVILFCIRYYIFSVTYKKKKKPLLPITYSNSLWFCLFVYLSCFMYRLVGMSQQQARGSQGYLYGKLNL